VEDNDGSALSIKTVIDQYSNFLQENLCILHSNIPLISIYSLRDFLTECIAHSNSVQLCVSNLNKNVDDYDKIIHYNDNYIIESHLNPNLSIFEYIYCNLFYIPKKILIETISTVPKNEYSQGYEIFDIFKSIKEKIKLYIIHSYIANKEFILLKSYDDKNLIEEIHMEKKNAFFITQCYEFWKKFDSLENRIHIIENKLDIE